MKQNILVGCCCEPADAVKFADSGFDYLEAAVWRDLVPEQPDDVFLKTLESFRSSPVPFLTANGFFPGDLRLIGPDADIPRAVRYAEKAFSRAEQIGIRKFVFGSGGARRIPDGFSRETAQNQLTELLKRIAPAALNHGVTVTVEPLRPAECNVLNTVPAGAALVQQVNHPGIRLLADSFHWTDGDRDIQALTWCAPLIRHIHIATFPKRANPGYDNTDFKPFLSVLKHAGYHDFITFEGAWADGPEAERLRRCAEYIRTVWNEIQ